MVSIIVPCYNCYFSIGKLIESIFKQTYNDWELILIDDGSKDKTIDQLEHYSSLDNRIKIFRQENQGVSGARNRGIKEAHGEFVTFIDSDDWIDDTYLEHLILLQGKFQSDLTITGYKEISNNQIKEIRPEEGSYTTKEISKILNSIKEGNLLLPICSKLYKKNIIDNYNLTLPSEISFGEDATFTFRYVCHIKKIAYGNFSDYNYKRNDNSLSTIRPDFNIAWKEFSFIKDQIEKTFSEYINNLTDYEFIKHYYLFHYERLFASLMLPMKYIARKKGLKCLDRKFLKNNKKYHSYKEYILYKLFFLKQYSLLHLIAILNSRKK